MSENEISHKEKRVRSITHIYYSKPEVQKAIVDFCRSREVSPRYFDGFGKRPDTLEYQGDLYQLTKKGATSFHCSQEIWKDPLKIETGMSEEKLNELRTGWDFVIDIDSKYLDYSKIMAQEIIRILKFHGIKNFSVKFSGSKGFHIIVPWKSFPEKVLDKKTSDMFPEYPRIITKYIMEKVEKNLVERISDLERPNKYVKDFKVSKEVMPDLILVSPRHLFRAPYSLHEKTALASVVIPEEDLENFQPKDADPMNAKIIDFMPSAGAEGEASELLMQALDWHKDSHQDEESFKEKKSFDYKPIKIDNLSDKNFPDSIKKILEGLQDGKKRALFILLNFFRSVGMDRDELEKRLYDWNEKNKPPMKTGYVKTQITWSYRNKIVPPPNFDKDYYKGIGIIPTQEELRYKNPVNYTAKKSFTFTKKTSKKNK